MPRPLFCGDPMCKQAVAIPAGSRWPFFCPSCSAALYPHDVMERLHKNEIEPRATELMTDSGGKRVPIGSKELDAKSTHAGGGAAAGGDLDKILDMVDVDPKATAAARRRRSLVIAGVIALIAVIVLFLVFRH